MTTNRFKYPRTSHLPWSPGATADDVKLDKLAVLSGRDIVVTEKMDGENTSLYRDGIHARSLDSRYHPSRNWVKGQHAKIAFQIPPGWRICGENIFAQHSIAYQQLPSFFMVFSIWDHDNRCLSWDQTRYWCERLQLCLVPTWYEGVCQEQQLRRIVVDTRRSEGYVVRLRSGFHYSEFSDSVAKWVRSGHVQTRGELVFYPGFMSTTRGDLWRRNRLVPGLTDITKGFLTLC